MSTGISKDGLKLESTIRVTLESFLQHLINQSKKTTETFDNSLKSLPNTTLASILEIVPNEINVCIFKHLSYTILYSLCKAPNQAIKLTAQACLIRKMQKQLNISYVNKDNYLQIFDLLSQSFFLLSENSTQIPLEVKVLADSKSLEDFLNKLELIPFDELLFVNQHLCDLNSVGNNDSIKLFLNILTNKINGHQARIALLDQSTLYAYTYELLTCSLETKNLEILKISLLLYPNITELYSFYTIALLTKALNQNFHEYIETIIENLFITNATTLLRDKVIVIGISIIEKCVFSNNVKLLLRLLNKMPLNTQEVLKTIQTLKSSIDLNHNQEPLKSTALYAIDILKKHYNLL